MYLLINNLNWEDLRGNIELLCEQLNQYSSRKIADLCNNQVSARHVRRHANRHGLEYDKELNKWCFSDESESKKVDNDSNSQQKENLGTKQGEEERKPDKEDFGDYWVIRSKDRSFEITKEKYKKIRRDYSGQNYLTINQLCRKHKIPRWQFTLLKNAFSFTHDDVPFTDEEILNNNPDELAEKELQRRKDQYFKKLREKELDNALKELKKYRKKDYYINKINRMVNNFFEDFIDRYKKPIIPELETVNSDMMLELPIVDLHLARLCWEPETGENYDRHIASQKFMYIIDEIINRTKRYDFEKILFPVGSDFFNYDDLKGDTTKGTRQDNDSRWQKMIETGEELLIKGIDKLSQVAKVDTFWIPGNHDWSTSYHLIRTLHAWYKDNPNVEVDTSPKARKYRKYGINLIGFTHGDKERKRIFGDMQMEVPELWGKTRYREWHAAHLHSEHVKEQNGIILRRLSSPANKSAWEYGKGYQSHPGSQAFIWHKEKALYNILPVNFV